ncbi:MAG: sigma-70 family RNA polymerase sigma factor [Solirubrobacteraceae bacterium]
MAAIADGDDAAFSVFYRRHLAMVAAVLLRETRDREATADLCAEVFSAVLLAASRYRDIGPAGPWVLGIARNKLRESRRRGRIRDRARRRLEFAPLALDDADLDEVETLAVRGEGDLLALLDSLPEHERAAVRARVLGDQSYEQIAKQLRCSQMVARKRVSRGLARIRARLEQQ